MKRKSYDLETRCDDLTDAMRAIGRILVDATVTPKQRIAQVVGVLRMYDCAAAPSERVVAASLKVFDESTPALPLADPGTRT